MSEVTPTQFADFQLKNPIYQAFEKMGYTTPTEVQAASIPLALEGKDLLVTAQTGTGKTAAFAVPLLNKILSGPKKPVLILAPTRELAEQIHKVILQLTDFCRQVRSTLIIGGTAYHHQIRQLRMQPLFVIGTPGRVIDQMSLGNLKLSQFGALVIDEADRLLDMGFEPQLEEIVAQLPADRQTLLFSATLPKEIENMAKRYMKEPERIAIGQTSKPVERIEQSVIETTSREKSSTLIKEIDKVAGTLIVFTRTKDRAEMVTRILTDAGHEATYLHGDLSQRQRSQAVESFRRGRFRILVATDIAARGLDIPHIRHVVNYDLPQCAEDYVHRIGRTARNGAEGSAMAFVTPEDYRQWSRIHKLIYGFFPKRPDRQKVERDGKFRHSYKSHESPDLNRSARRSLKFGTAFNAKGPQGDAEMPRGRSEDRGFDFDRSGDRRAERSDRGTKRGADRGGFKPDFAKRNERPERRPWNQDEAASDDRKPKSFGRRDGEFQGKRRDESGGERGFEGRSRKPSFKGSPSSGSSERSERPARGAGRPAAAGRKSFEKRGDSASAGGRSRFGGAASGRPGSPRRGASGFSSARGGSSSGGGSRRPGSSSGGARRGGRFSDAIRAME